MEVEVHEFWMKGYPRRWDDNVVYRVALGELIDAPERKTYKPQEDSNSGEWGNKTGSIGFMDVMVKEELVPKEGMDDFDCDYENVRALTILTVGIEPEHMQKGYARFLKKRAEEIAKEWNLYIVVSDMIENPIMRDFDARLGYQLYNDGFCAIKRLNVSGQ